MLRNRDFVRCGASCRLRREPCHRQVDRKRREKQALAFAKIERSGHSKQMDTKCQMQSISAQAQFV